jgi:hypothetical protein
LGFDSVNVGRVDSLSAGLRKAPATSKRMAGANGPKYDVSLVKYFSFTHGVTRFADQFDDGAFFRTRYPLSERIYLRR